jgi:hypothetical protein
MVFVSQRPALVERKAWSIGENFRIKLSCRSFFVLYKSFIFAGEIKTVTIMATTTMEQPKKVVLTYDKTNPVAKKTLDFILSLGVFQLDKSASNQVATGLEEYRQGKYTVINKGKRKD